MTDETESEEVIEEKQEEKQPTPDEAIASKHNWVPKDKYKGDPDDWISAAAFNARGEFIGKIRGLEKKLKDSTEDFTNRLENQRKLHEVQLEATISDLESRRREAIDSADVDKAESIQSNIDKVRTQMAETKAAPQPATEPEENPDQEFLEQWDKNNPWIYDNSPKAAYGNARFDFHRKRGLSPQDAVKFMESEVASQFPPINRNRDKAPAVENGSSTSNKAQKLTWDRLTAEEKKFYSPRRFKSKEDFCQAVQDDRAMA